MGSYLVGAVALLVVLDGVTSGVVAAPSSFGLPLIFLTSSSDSLLTFSTAFLAPSLTFVPRSFFSTVWVVVVVVVPAAGLAASVIFSMRGLVLGFKRCECKD